MLAYIYKITNKINGKFYIGSTKNIDKRWYQHTFSLNNNEHHNSHLQNAWNKYGEDNFEFSVLEEVDEHHQFEKEQEYLDKLLPFGDKGYNISFDATNGFKRELKSKMCETCDGTFETYYDRQKYCCRECDPNYNPQWYEDNGALVDWITNKRIISSQCTYDCDIDYDWSVEDWIHAWMIDQMEK